MRRRISGLVAVILLLAVFTPGTGAHAASKAKRSVDVRIREPASNEIAQLKLDRAQARREIREAVSATSAPVTTQSTVGDEKIWLAADFVSGRLYLKDYTLRAIGNNIEVWVASDEDTVSTDTEFPAGDCRNDVRTEITDEQVAYLVDQFDNNILPKESATFSVAPDREGTESLIQAIFPSLGLPADYYTGDGDDTVALIDNVRDENFYDTNNSQGFSYVAGFFSPNINTLVDRNVMTIDAFDWLHRTGDNPPHEPTDNLCTSAPARPNLYEGVFAHEYQHLLLSYVDPAETTWMNEGLADWAQTLTGYVDTSIPITELGYDSHVQCFMGWLGVQTPVNPIPRDGGPENSLNLWGDQNDFEWEILCDYGAAYTMMELLADRFGEGFMGDLHQDAEHQGFDSVESLMGGAMSARELVDQWAAMVALDGVLDDGAHLKGGTKADFRVSTLDASINWDTIQTFSTDGAPPNGSDYVRLRDGSGAYLSASQVGRVAFDGANSLPPQQIDWVIDADPPGQPGDAALHSTDADSRNSVIVNQVDVPSGAPELTFDAAWDLESTFDFAYVQITDDGGETYTSLECTDTVDDTDPDLGNVGPGFGHGFNGFDDTPTFAPQACDLTPWAGETVGLAFRYFSDSNTHGAGFWADDVMIDDTLISDGSSFEGWQSSTQFNPVEVEAYTIRLIAYGGGNKAWIGEVPLDDDMNGVLTGGALRKAIGFQADVVAAIVTYHDSTELVQQYAPYSLRVNGVVQPGG